MLTALVLQYTHPTPYHVILDTFPVVWILSSIMTIWWWTTWAMLSLFSDLKMDPHLPILKMLQYLFSLVYWCNLRYIFAYVRRSGVIFLLLLILGIPWGIASFITYSLWPHAKLHLLLYFMHHQDHAWYPQSEPLANLTHSPLHSLLLACFSHIYLPLS